VNRYIYFNTINYHLLVESTGYDPPYRLDPHIFYIGMVHIRREQVSSSGISIKASIDSVLRR